MKFIISIDVEEDNWGEYQPERISVENIKMIPALQTLFDEFKVKPTYLIDYPVATDPFAIEIFSRYQSQGKCEIGMHCHPWNTPPITEEISEQNTMLCNLSEDLIYQKLFCLHQTICKNFKMVTVSFRAGRWGGGAAVTRSLYRLGYRIDSSVSPYIDWRANHGPDFSGFGPEPFGLHSIGIDSDRELYTLLQVPVTIGFLQPNFKRCQSLLNRLDTPFSRKLHIAGILNRLRLLNKVWLSPEKTDADYMIKLAQRMMKENYPLLNLAFHSTSLQAGLSPFVKSLEDELKFTHKIRKFLIFTQKMNIESCTLSEFYRHNFQLEIKSCDQSLPIRENQVFAKEVTL